MAGAVRHELRRWRTKYQGALAIHAAAVFPSEDRVLCAAPSIRQALLRADYADAAELPLQHVIGVASLVGCCRLDAAGLARLIRADPLLRYAGPAIGLWVWCYQDARTFTEPIPWPGKRGIENIPDNIEELAESWRPSIVRLKRNRSGAWPGVDEDE